jgi:hypothetical protein
MPNAGSTTFWRKRGTMRVPHSHAARKRSHSGAQSSTPNEQIVERRRGSASPRHISASSAFISRAVPHASGALLPFAGLLIPPSL